MKMRGIVGAVLQVLAWLFVVNTSTGQKFRSKSACYKSNVTINCPHFRPNTTYKLLWQFKDKTAPRWTDLAMIKNGNRTVFPHNSTLDERITLHPNGSLGITSLHPDDERLYQCISYDERGRIAHVTDLKVSCGRTTVIKREVCADDDVMLECEAWHRTNPRKLDQVTWHKKKTSGNDVSWSLLVASSGSNGKVGDGFKLHGNGSLQLHGGMAEKVATFRCVVTKNVPRRLDKHIIEVKSVMCKREKLETTGSVKTTAGRVAMTTPITVTMATTTPSVSSASSDVHGMNHVLLVSVIFTWLMMNLLTLL